LPLIVFSLLFSLAHPHMPALSSPMFTVYPVPYPESGWFCAFRRLRGGSESTLRTSKTKHNDASSCNAMQHNAMQSTPHHTTSHHKTTSQTHTDTDGAIEMREVNLNEGGGDVSGAPVQSRSPNGSSAGSPTRTI
jgi:hypothetical protein